MQLRPRSRISLEIIDHQNDNFGEKLEFYITSICESIRKNLTVDDAFISTEQLALFKYNYTNKKIPKRFPEEEEIEKLIFKRTGIKVQLRTSADIVASVLPLYLNKNTVFLPDFLRGNIVDIPQQEKFINKLTTAEGFVNTHTAKVGGIFSEYEHIIWLNFYVLHWYFKLTPGEITAGLLHELGHAFYFLEYSDRIDRTNQVLANAAKEVFSKKDKKDMKYVYRELTSINKHVTEEEVERLMSDDRIVAGTTWYSVVINSHRASQLQNEVYARTAPEQLADNFVARFGYGREFISSSEKMHLYDPDKIQFNSKFAVDVVTLFVGGASVFLGYLSIVAPIVVIGSFLIHIFALQDFEHKRDYTYDDLKIRYKRIRQQLISYLKQADLTKKQMKDTVDAVTQMDKVIEETYIHRGLFSKLGNLLSSSARDANRQIKYEQLTEALVHNDLYLMSTKFKTI